METLHKMLDFVRENPTFTAVFVVPLITAVFNFFFKWRSEEEYQRMNPYLRTLIRFTSAFGVDPVKGSKVIEEELLKKKDK